MATFSAADGTRLAYHQAGEGDPLICLPGGPMQASAYLGDLGGLSAHRSLIRLDLRGTGESAVPADPASYRCDRLVDDVEALRVHLGRDRIDLLGHSAGGTLAVLYAARYPDRIGRLALVTPSPLVVGLEITDLDRRHIAELRRGEAWFPDAFAALERIWSGDATAADAKAIEPFKHGRWDANRQARLALEASQKNAEPAAGTTRPAPLTRKPPDPPSPAIGRRSFSSRASTTSRFRRSAPPSMPACSVRPSWPCSRAADTIPGSTIRSGSCRPWQGSRTDSSMRGRQPAFAERRTTHR
ncbi:Pimeloyl-ACP methyl ester carboxylesterase [Micromonospora rhizosphaerae]|uniref:Pimeloyl-ACP methyl ester carboxylesterase n=1 Tax=Micromonospora rhizosphaerae TaxID=568872 RepID=A0A1C6SIU9_9ACTN|nr:Pimeloyl-ACP methyl ester carboxylesterase [Micromonospora rhizosphaerae]